MLSWAYWGVSGSMQLLIESKDGGQVVEERVRHAAAGRVVRPIVLHGVGRSSLAAALGGVQRSGVPCIVEEASGEAAELAALTELDLSDAADTREWTIAIWVGERNQHRWLLSPSGEFTLETQPVVLERHSGGHKLVYFGAV
jgi:hypothetical protein